MSENNGQDKFLSRPSYGISSVEARIKTANSGFSAASGQSNNPLGSVSPVGTDGIPRGPSRKWYEPEYTGLSLLLPKNRLQKNRWRRYFYTYDPIIGGVIDLHAEMPHSPARLFGIDDQEILDHYNKAVERVDLWNILPEITREYLKIGEAFPYLRWDDSEKNFSHIILQNPDFIEIEQSMFIDEGDKYYLTADPRIKTLIEGNEPLYRDIKSKLPIDFLRAIFYGEKMPLPFDENDLFIGLIKRNSPGDVRGTSIIDRTFKYLIYEDKLLDSQIAIADNTIFPIRIFKFGNENWTPNEDQLAAFQEILLARKFDPDFYFLTHNAVTYENHSLNSDVMNLSAEWDRIDKSKMVSLGVSQTFLTGESSYASAHIAFQTAISRYRTLRSMIESQFLNKFFYTIAERAGFYKVSIRELNGNYRVASRERELIVPRLDWEKKLTVREESSYLSFLQGLMGKFPISESTFLSAIGMSLKEELLRSVEDKKLKIRLGINIKDDFSVDSGEESEGEEGSGLFASLWKRKNKFAKKKQNLPLDENIKDENIKKDEISGYLFKLARSIVEIEKSKGVHKNVEDVYSELLSSLKDKYSEDTFFTGSYRKISDSLTGEFLKSKNGVSENNESSILLDIPDDVFLRNYEKNANSIYPDRIRHLLKNISSEINSLSSSAKSISFIISDIVVESLSDAERFIKVGGKDIDKEFIIAFLKSDLTNSVHRYASNKSIPELEVPIKKIALAAVLLGYSQYYSSQGVEDVFLLNHNGLVKMPLSTLYTGGVDTLMKYVNSGIIPYILPVLNSDVDTLRKYGFLTSFSIHGIHFENCPKSLSLFLCDYIKYSHKYFLNNRSGNSKHIKHVIFCDSVESHPDFKKYVKTLYSIKDEDSYQFILDNEKRKISSKKNFIFGDTLYINFNLFEDFSSLFDCFEYILPLDKEKLYSDKKYKFTKYLSLTQDEIESAINEGWLVRYSQEHGDIYRVVSRIKDNVYTFVDYYDLIGVPVIIDSTDAVYNILRLCIDSPHVVDKSVLEFFSD